MNSIVLEVDMENREPVDIARDAAEQIAALFDPLVEEQKRRGNVLIFS